MVKDLIANEFSWWWRTCRGKACPFSGLG